MIENLIFSQLLQNDAYARAVLPHVKPDYFSTQEEKNFFKIYERFFQKHNKIPSKQAMLVEIEKLKSSADVYESLKKLTESTEEFHETLPWLISETEKFCKEKALFNALRESVLIMDGQAKDKQPEAIPSIITAALSIAFDTSVGHDYLADAESRYEYYHHTEARVSTGIRLIDKITRGGFPKKTFNVVLAPPHGGKSLKLVNIGAGALTHGANVLYITMEMAAEEIGKRFDVNMLNIDFDTLEVLPKSTFSAKFRKISEKSKGRLIIKEFPTGSASAANFRALLAELKTKQNFVPDMVIIDYMNICASEIYKAGSNQNTYTVVGSIGKELRAFAIENNCAVVSATQTNRSGIGASDIDQSAMSDSAGTNMIADWILAIISTDELKKLNQVMFKQIKNRYNGTSDFERFLMGVDYAKQQLYDLEASSAPEPAPAKLNSKPAVSFDPAHEIKPEKASFSDFNFDDE